VQIRFEPIGQPIAPDEIQGRLNAGWMIAGQVVVKPDKANIATLDQPEANQPIPCNLWVLPEPTIQANDLLQLLVSEYNVAPRAAQQVLDEIASAVYGQTIKDMLAQQEQDLVA